MENSFLLMLADAAKISLVSSVIAFVYVTILTQPGQALNWLCKLLWKAYGKVFTGDNYFNYQWVMNPIVECELCVAGQMALWICIFTLPFNLITLIFTICLSILIAKSLSRLIR